MIKRHEERVHRDFLQELSQSDDRDGTSGQESLADELVPSLRSPTMSTSEQANARTDMPLATDLLNLDADPFLGFDWFGPFGDFC